MVRVIACREAQDAAEYAHANCEQNPPYLEESVVAGSCDSMSQPPTEPSYQREDMRRKVARQIRKLMKSCKNSTTSQ
eukprot:5942312-Prorocentrum_lima.AAC.1